MQLRPYAMAIVNDLFDDDLDADLLAEPASDAEPTPCRPAEPARRADAPRNAPRRRLQ